MLFVLVGARGAGKTTLLDTLRTNGVGILQPSTTRPKRHAEDTEYDFVSEWNDQLYAWSIAVGTHTYGMRRTEIIKAKEGVWVTVFDPLNIGTFEAVRLSLRIDVVTVGLDTIVDAAEQRRRVGDDQTRQMDEASFAEAQEAVSRCDMVLSGKADRIAAAFLATIRILGGRGGVLTKVDLVALTSANVLLVGVDQANVRSASYDLRIGREILCLGKIIELSDNNPRFEIPPYSYAIVSALEQASLPPFVIGRFDLKVSLFFEGVILSNGPQVDPGYKGALFCMLYNGSGRPKLLTLGRHFATIDFTSTMGITEGYRQKYQLKKRMAEFVTDEAVTGLGGAIVPLIDEKIRRVDRKIQIIRGSFWAIATGALALIVGACALVVPVLWGEIDRLNTARLAIEENRRQTAEMLVEARRERAEAARLLTSVRAEVGQWLEQSQAISVPNDDGPPQ